MELLPAILVAGIAIAPNKIQSDNTDKRIQDALRIMRRVLQTQKDAPNAMCRDDLGTIGFRYGKHFPAVRNRDRSGYGLVHVICSAKEDVNKYEGAPAPEQVLSIIPEVILKSGKPRKVHHGRLRLEYNGHIALLTKSGKNPKAPKWLFHAYKLYPKNSFLPVGGTAP